MTPPLPSHQKQLVSLIAKINGGDSMNPVELFDNLTGGLKNEQALYDVCFQSLKSVLPQTSQNWETSMLLMRNVEEYTNQGWVVVGGRVQDTETSKSKRKILLKQEAELHLSDFFTKSFDLHLVSSEF